MKHFQTLKPQNKESRSVNSLIVKHKTIKTMLFKSNVTCNKCGLFVALEARLSELELDCELLKINQYGQ